MSVCGNLISEANIEVLQRIQSSAIKNIFKYSFMTNLKNLVAANRVLEITLRLEDLLDQYIFGIKPLSHENPPLAQKNNTKKQEQLTLSHDVRGYSTSTHKSNNNTGIEIRHALCMHNDN
jgi:hypothetical protein